MNRTYALRGSAGVLVALLIAAGCASPVPTPSPEPTASKPPAMLTVQQDQDVINAVGDAVNKADAAKDATLLASRLVGPALAMRSAQIKIAAGLGKDDLLRSLPTDVEQQIIPTTQGWPRAAYAVTVRPADLGANRLLVLDQNGARDPYSLWGWVQLFPGITVPTFNKPTVGSEAVAPDDASLAMKPVDAVAQYADVLTLGKSSPFAATFGDDQFRKVAEQNVATQTAAVALAAGSYSMKYTPDTAQTIHAVRTADGGALVMAALSGAEVSSVEVNGTVQGVGGQLVFLANAPATNVLNSTYTAVIAMYIPKAGSTSPIQVLGGERQLTGASR